MNTRLKYVTNWTDLAIAANWSVKTMSKNCGVSVETLRRHFIAQFGKAPRAWIAEKRLAQAHAILRKGMSVKEAATFLGYSQQTNFSRKFKDHWGVSPTAASKLDTSFCDRK